MPKAISEKPALASLSSGKGKEKLDKIKTDILISIQQPHMNNIVAQTKNHEFRKYQIPSTVKRMWFYVSSPDQRLLYIATISTWKRPGKLPEDGIGNAEFNRGEKVSKFAYEIQHLHKLRMPLRGTDLKSDYGIGPPQKYSYVPGKLFRDIVVEEQEKLF